MPLTYCLNIHPGESWTDQFSAIRNHAMKVRNRVSPGRPFGLGLRLSGRSSRQLLRPTEMERFRDFLARNHSYAFTINGFPYGQFHGACVKEKVYQPDWRSVQRRDYTLRLIQILSELLPDGIAGSISTVPGSFKPCITTKHDVNTMVRHMMDCVIFMAKVRERTGKEIHLGLEPEPGCYFENTPETVAFFNHAILTAGLKDVRRRLKCSAGSAEKIIRRHLGICLDTCHLAIQFEDLTQSLKVFRREGIRISKIHLSAALEVAVNHDSLRALKPFCEGVYLHQVKALCRDGSLLSWNDLPAALKEIPHHPEAEHARIHFHIPLFFKGSRHLGTTAACLTPDFFAAIQSDPAQHIEIETYTFDVLPKKLRSSSVVTSISKEFEWVSRRM